MDHARLVETDKVIQEYILQFFLKKKEVYKVWRKVFDPDQPWDNEPGKLKSMATPLYYTSLAGLEQTVKMLLKAGADIK